MVIGITSWVIGNCLEGALIALIADMQIESAEPRIDAALVVSDSIIQIPTRYTSALGIGLIILFHYGKFVGCVVIQENIPLLDLSHLMSGMIKIETGSFAGIGSSSLRTFDVIE